MHYHYPHIRSETPVMQVPDNTPLTDDELDQLDAFLLDRIPEDESSDVDTRDEGVICIPELDGLLTAVVVGPELIPPSKWWPAVWGDVEPVWESMEDFQVIMSLMVRHMNSIVHGLMADPPQCQPLFEERLVDDVRYTIVDEWCEGFVRGMDLCSEAWNVDDDELFYWIVPIDAFTERAGWPGHEMSPEEGDALRNAIEPAVISIHQYWLQQRRPPSSPAGVQSSALPRAGRNDPCPCGSGRKFKKCCLQ